LSELIINLETVDPVDFFGVNNTNLRILKQSFNKLKILARGDKIMVAGAPEDLDEFQLKVDEIFKFFNRHGKLTKDQLEEILNNTPLPAVETADLLDDVLDDVLVYGTGGRLVKAKTPNQKKMVKTSEQNDVMFAIGPAGTGKTYTAVALAVRALKNKWVKKIILTRPAVEAGENLGFLPGDLKEKIDPYLRPLYDALDDMIPHDKLSYYMTTRVIEVAPLAFMRGRTLDNAFMILDEAQNATESQLKMFLTRIGPSAKCIITGDITQIDLPKNQESGLGKTIERLKDIKGIGVMKLDNRDVVRHKLVKEIIKAFEKEM
jgi:phosphate starvation-inducible PhoH-like protein